MSERDGGAAFPQVESEGAEDGIGGHHYSHVYSYGGMSLRDYFAAQALAGLCGGNGWPTPKEADEMARRSYLFADAMLKAREA